MTKSLLLKGLAGVAAVGGTVGGGIIAVNSGLLRGAEIKEGESKFTQKELIDKVGLSCGLEGDEIGEETKDCKVKENGTISIKVESQTEEGVTFTASDSAKLKVGRSKEGGVGEGTEVYNGKLKFVVDSGDITLSKKDGGTNPTNIQKLEQFETYEIKEEGDKFYLERKTKADIGIKNALGLGELTLPTAGGEVVSRSYGDAGNIKLIRFEGHSEGISVTSGEIGLKVSKTVDTTTFPYGYRFNFTFPADVTINTKSLKAKIPYEFKIKKQANSNNLTLEQAWTDDNTFTKKAGLDCSSNKECSVSTESQKLNVKVGNEKKEGISSLNTGTGKIKMETEQVGYNQGLKFTIADGDVTLGDGGTGDAITKLEELETYEITEDGGKYYLTKKTSPDELIKSSLGIKDVCELPTTDSPVNCSLDEAKFKAIKFEGKDTDKPSGTATLTISKGNSTDFPFGYRFTFKTESDAAIKTSSTTIKGKIPTDFKIKKNTSSGTGASVTLTLEKAWSDFSLAEKVGLKCTGTTGSECCTMNSAGGSPSVKLNVKKGSDIKTDIESVSTTSPAKIKVEKDQVGYNQGLKFTITGGDVTLTGGNKVGNSTDFNTLEELETYEITEDKGKYYLTRKTGASEAIESQLGLKEAGCSLSGASSNCSNLTSDKLQKINFSDKESEKPTISTGTATLTITKTDNKTDFPLGYKFTLQSTTGDITIKNTGGNSNIVKKGISTDFKIKRPTGGTGSLTLEKAWTPTTLGAKVGLKCCDDSTNECTIDGTDGKKLWVKQESKYNSDIKSGGLSKSSSGSTAGKIKVTKDQAGYNQGFKFEISEGSIDLTGSSGTEDDDKIHTLGEFETYEIKEEDDKQWYLVRKDRADKFIKGQLKLVDAGCSESENLPHTNAQSTTCDIKSLENLKKIKFEGNNGNGSNISGTVNDNNKVQLQIKKDSKLPGGFKFTFSGGENVCLPNGSSGKVSLGSSGVDYKIKKGTTGGTTTLTLEKCGNGGSSSTCT